MAAPVKFLFDTEFAAEAKREAEPKVTLAEHRNLIALARQEGQAAGFLAGEAEAMASVERQRAIAFAAIGDRLTVAAEALRVLEGRLEQEAIDIAVAVAGRLAGALTAREPLAEIRRLVGDCFANLRGVPHLVVRVHDDLMEQARTELTRLASERGFEGRLVILAEPTIAIGDCRIEWSTGGIMLDRDEITMRIAEAVERYVASHPAGTSEAQS
ncbi:MAG: flagellar assembly protein FliH [Phreatobacter sp.]|uniref:FliH/SctL family protein n=1 Tax=Phreatobacter sp. TaxID=1966341 RepID=UPI001A4D821E|nr:FliH/SctL family protein [Phreatobacter sp.]MBL8567667.1 flagellar assembly protein FliH [Phreatobacter sp.]